MNDYLMVETSTGAYAVSPELIRRVAYQAAYYANKNRSKKLVPSKDGFGLPQTYRYDFDFKAAQQAGNTAANGTLDRLFGLIEAAQLAQAQQVSQGVGLDIAAFREELVDLEGGTRRNKEEITRALKKAASDSMRSIDSTVRGWGIAAQVATITRDVSADVFVVCAGALSGGAAIAGLGVGSVAKGAFKYQDTENVAAAVFEGTTSFVVGVIPVPKIGQAGRAQHYGMLFAKGQLEAGGQFATALIEGKEPLNAAMSVGTSMAGGALAGRLVKGLEVKDLGVIKGLIGNTALPVKVRVKADVSGKAVAQLVGQKLAEASGKTAGGAAAQALNRALTKKKAVAGAVRLPLGDPVLADLAIVGPDASTPPRRFRLDSDPK